MREDAAMALGGSYIVGKDGKKRLVDGTADHPDGNCARDADGKPRTPRAADLDKAKGNAGDKK